jgi:hypothetical protein
VAILTGHAKERLISVRGLDAGASSLFFKDTVEVVGRSFRLQRVEMKVVENQERRRRLRPLVCRGIPSRPQKLNVVLSAVGRVTAAKVDVDRMNAVCVQGYETRMPWLRVSARFPWRVAKLDSQSHLPQ